jgi:hypothetical protein
MGSPQSPTKEQIATLEKAGQLATTGKPKKIKTSGGKATVNVMLPQQGVSLLKWIGSYFGATGRTTMTLYLRRTLVLFVICAINTTPTPHRCFTPSTCRISVYPFFPFLWQNRTSTFVRVLHQVTA